MKKIYIVEKAKNGFIIKFDYLKCAFETPKLCVAKTIDEVIKILKADMGLVKKDLILNVIDEVETKKTDTKTDTLLVK